MLVERAYWNSVINPYGQVVRFSARAVSPSGGGQGSYLKGQLTKMVLKLAFELRAKQKLSACITVKIRYTDFNTYTLQQKIPYTASDKILLSYAQQLFTKLYQRRQMIRLIGVKFSHLVAGNYQTKLFEDTPEEVNLLGAMDQIRQRFGAGAITLGNTIG